MRGSMSALEKPFGAPGLRPAALSFLGLILVAGLLGGCGSLFNGDKNVVEDPNEPPESGSPLAPAPAGGLEGASSRPLCLMGRRSARIFTCPARPPPPQCLPHGWRAGHLREAPRECRRTERMERGLPGGQQPSVGDAQVPLLRGRIADARLGKGRGEAEIAGPLPAPFGRWQNEQFEWQVRARPHVTRAVAPRREPEYASGLLDRARPAA